MAKARGGQAGGGVEKKRVRAMRAGLALPLTQIRYNPLYRYECNPQGEREGGPVGQTVAATSHCWHFTTCTGQVAGESRCPTVHRVHGDAEQRHFEVACRRFP